MKEFTPTNNNHKYNNINGLRAFSAIGIAIMHYQANWRTRQTLWRGGADANPKLLPNDT